MRFNYLTASLVLAASLSPAITARAQHKTTADDMPQKWLYTESYEMTAPETDMWWTKFGDATLDSLIRLGTENNYDLRTAARRIEMAALSIDQARSGYYPTLGASAGWTAQRQSGVTTSQKMSATDMQFFNLGLNMNWQIDIFGKNKAATQRAEATYNATRMQYDAAMVSIAAKIGMAYMQLRTLQTQQQVLDAHIKQQKRVLDITMARHEAGIASMLDVSQARTTYYSTVASESALNTSVATTINALAVLVGAYPEQLKPLLEKNAPMPDYRQIVAVGVPVDLLRRRPDIAEAEYQLAAYAQALGVAKKDFLPVLSLSGSIGTSAHTPGDLFTGRSFTYTVAPTLSWTIFDGKYRSSARESARQQMLAGIDAYNSAVLTAVQEADNAMATYYNSLRYIDSVDDALKSAEESFNLSFDLYKQGLTAFINVTNAQITYLQFANELVSARGQALSALITLYEALGGGWQN